MNLLELDAFITNALLLIMPLMMKRLSLLHTGRNDKIFPRSAGVIRSAGLSTGARRVGTIRSFLKSVSVPLGSVAWKHDVTERADRGPRDADHRRNRSVDRRRSRGLVEKAEPGRWIGNRLTNKRPGESG